MVKYNIIFYFKCYEWVLYKAKQLDWSEESAKALVVIGDCEPHPPSYTDQKINWHSELDILKGMGVKVFYMFFHININQVTAPCKNQKSAQDMDW